MVNTKFQSNVKKREIEQRENIEGMKNTFFSDTDAVTKQILQKFANQWSSLKKAFKDLSQSEKGYIHSYDLQHLFEHWGLQLNQEQFEKVFQKFDYDNDGKISYNDLQRIVGKILAPYENLYFR